MAKVKEAVMAEHANGEAPKVEKKPRKKRSTDEKYQAIKNSIFKLSLEDRLKLADEVKAETQEYLDAELQNLEDKKARLLAHKS